MFMDELDLKNMDYWYAVEVRYGFGFADIIVISTRYHAVETPYIFKKHPALCYFESMRDQAIKYMPDYGYLQLINTLRTRYPHMQVDPKRLGRNYDKNIHRQ